MADNTALPDLAIAQPEGYYGSGGLMGFPISTINSNYFGAQPNLGAPQPIVDSTLTAGGSGPVSAAPNTTALPLSIGATPTQQAGTPAAQPPGPATGSIADYFARTIIVILGFIFVAVGLHMLAPNTVPDVRKMVT